ncbi:MAG: NUDIX hydrolase [Candidatus Pacebacteria bacterium]|nr:NUDIX hydrolase [Candidatus Paceibacterota bacterium]
MLHEEDTSTKAYVFLQRDDKVLFVRDKDRPDFKLPGGRVEKGELVTEGALREVLEETGYTTELMDVVGLQNYVNKRGNAIVRFYFRGTIVGGSERIQEEEIEEIRWCTKKEIQEMIDMNKTLTQYSHILKKYLSGSMHDLTMLEHVVLPEKI